MNKLINVGIIGTGYGSYVLLEALSELSYVNKIYIYGRNKLTIKRLQKNKKVEIAYNSLKRFFDNKDFSMICIATLPSIQYQILRKINKKRYKFFFLEKPLANNIDNIEKIYRKFKTNSNFTSVDFIFLGLNSFIKFKKILMLKKILKVKITWHFKAHHYQKKIEDSWKKDSKIGGGIYFYYIVHIVSYIYFLFGRVKRIKNKNEKFDNSNDLNGVKLELETIKNIEIQIDFNSNSKKNIHKIEAFSKKRIYTIKKQSKDHIRNFFISIKDNNNNLIKNIKTEQIPSSKKDSRIFPVKYLLHNLIIKKNPISSISDTVKISRDLQKIIDF